MTFKAPHLKSIIFFLALIFSISINAQTTINIPISSSSDDAEEDTSSGAIDLTSSDTELCDDSGNQLVGFRFQNVTVPQGATITNAYIQFKSDDDDSSALTITIQGIDTDNTTTYTTSADNISDRIDGDITSGTTATSSWSPATWTNNALGVAQRTPNLSTIVKEIVDRGGWSSGNAMGFVFSSPSSRQRRADSFDQNPSEAAILHIEYIMIYTEQEIDITGNSNNIIDGSTTIATTNDTDFGNTTVGSPVSHTFTIENPGILPLNLTGGPLVSISGDASFSVTTQPSASTIAAGNSLTFVVQYSPSTTGLNTATISIANNDSNENPYTFDVQGSNLNIVAGGAWSYLDDGSDQGTAWYGTAFNYAGWATGNAELGYGDGDEVTVVNDGRTIDASSRTTYFRKSFTVTAADVVNSTLVMNAIRDDGMIVYIDGNQVWRNNMPAIFDYTTDASGTIGGAGESTWNTKSIVNPFLTPGTYEIGVEIHQASGTSSDISFNFELYTNNDYIFIPPPAPDVDADGVDDYIDSDDDNDGVPDIIEGCYTANFEGLNSVGGTTGPEEDIAGTISGSSLTMDDGNVINFTTTGTFNRITSYYAGEHGWAVRTHGAGTLGTLTFDFASDVSGLFFKLVDFDENETYTVNAYDSTNTLIDLTTSNNIYHLGSYVTQTGNTFYDHYFGTGGNNNGDVVSSDVYGSVYFYFPSTAISKIDFIVDQPDGSTIRIAAMHFCGLDTDGDGVDDYYDSDSDNDGIPDLVEAGGTDIDGNGIIDNLTDTDIDGLPDRYDSTPNVYFAEEITTLPDLDFDGDGYKNRIDLDSDNDGIVDLIEAGGIDTNGDAKLDAFVDADSDGYHDSFDGATSLLITGADTDADGFPNSYLVDDDADSTGLPNFLDIDSDDDGITDNTEAQATGSYISPANSDTDSGGFVDGIDDNYDDDAIGFGGSGLIPVDTDFDGTPDYLDTNSDDAEEVDAIEGHDSNGDGVADAGSNADTGIPVGTDSDNDGLDDGYDNDDAGFDATNTSLTAASHPIFDAGTDRDWRATIAHIDFDGLNDHIIFGDKHKINGAYSFEAWVLQENTTVSGGIVISKGDANAGNLRGYYLTIQPDNRPNASWYDSSGVKVLDMTSPFAISNNKWYHLAFVYNGSTAIMYIDGIAVATATPSVLPDNGNENSMIGAMYDSSTPTLPKNFFNGFIDEVRFWNVALSASQIHEMMNQEIQQNGTSVRGMIIPRDISSNLKWNDSDGYYNMNADNAQDNSSKGFNGFPKNITTIQTQTAPIPYVSVRSGNWSDTSAATPWLYGDSVWTTPSSLGVDGATMVDWNIVVVDKDVITANQDVKLLGLISNSDALVTDENILDSQLILGADGNDYELNISRYLKLDGKIDLENESQLIQSDGSWLDITSKGYVERDQQGTQNAFTYNYWSSPVAKRSTTTNNLAFNVTDVLRDGSNAANPVAINFGNPYAYADGALEAPVKISNYWIWKFVNLGNAYANWQFVGSANNLNVTEGYTMKGTSGASAVSTKQNYVFRGKPNNILNGATEMVHTTFGVPADPTNPYITLTGNPFLSAIDANAFINDNATSTTQTIYFWEHWGGGTHILGEYQGGYSTYTKAGSTPTPTLASSHPDVDQTGSGGILPGQYIPVGQGFFVVSSATGGDVVFKNSQRTFVVEGSNPNSNFSRTAPVEKIRIGFDSPDHYHRQLMVAFISGATDAIDKGYDAQGLGALVNDSFFLQEDERFVIQAFESFDEEREIQIVVIIDADEDGMVQKFMIDSLENISADKNIILKDNVANVYHDLRASNYEVALPAGEHKTRFSLVFKSEEVLAVDEDLLPENTITVFINNPTLEIVIKNTGSSKINKTTLFNSIGQTMNTWTHKNVQQEINLPINDLSTGIYIVQVETDNGTISQKIIIE